MASNKIAPYNIPGFTPPLQTDDEDKIWGDLEQGSLRIKESPEPSKNKNHLIDTMQNTKFEAEVDISDAILDLRPASLFMRMVGVKTTLNNYEEAWEELHPAPLMQNFSFGSSTTSNTLVARARDPGLPGEPDDSYTCPLTLSIMYEPVVAK